MKPKTIIDPTYTANEKTRIIDDINSALVKMFTNFGCLGYCIDDPETSDDYIVNYLAAVRDILNGCEDALYKDEAAAHQLRRELSEAPVQYVENIEDIIE